MINKILKSNLVQTNMNYCSWREAAKDTSKLLFKYGKIKIEYIDSVIETVEKFGPYMILLPKVCFFHGEPGINVIEPCLSLSVFENEIIFEDFDNQVIKCCFVFGAIDADSHIQILKELAEILRNQNFIDLITNNGSKIEIMKIIQMYKQ